MPLKSLFYRIVTKSLEPATSRISDQSPAHTHPENALFLRPDHDLPRPKPPDGMLPMAGSGREIRFYDSLILKMIFLTGRIFEPDK